MQGASGRSYGGHRPGIDSSPRAGICSSPALDLPPHCTTFSSQGSLGAYVGPMLTRIHMVTWDSVLSNLSLLGAPLEDLLEHVLEPILTSLKAGLLHACSVPTPSLLHDCSAPAPCLLRACSAPALCLCLLGACSVSALCLICACSVPVSSLRSLLSSLLVPLS